VTHGWQGRIALSADALPHLGRTRAGVYYALGYSGHGVALSLWCGHLLAEAVVRSAPLGILAELPFPTFRRGRPTRRHRLPTSPLVRPATPT
jgi:glycine/D-amino acid oxidase-like deaminating enzyme